MPVQSLPLALPPELVFVVRIVGEATHSVPPWKGTFCGWTPKKSRPNFWLSVFVHVTVKLPALFDGWLPLVPIEGTQPSEFVLPVQYTSTEFVLAYTGPKWAVAPQLPARSFARRWK